MYFRITFLSPKTAHLFIFLIEEDSEKVLIGEGWGLFMKEKKKINYQWTFQPKTSHRTQIMAEKLGKSSLGHKYLSIRMIARKELYIHNSMTHTEKKQ